MGAKMKIRTLGISILIIGVIFWGSVIFFSLKVSYDMQERELGNMIERIWEGENQSP